MTSEKRLARIAGSLYLIVADNIRASATLFRLGFVSDLVQATCFLLTAMALYLLLKHVNTLVASAMVTFVAVSVAIMCLNLLNQFVALSIATGEGYSSVFGSAGSDELAMLFVDMHHDGYLLAQMFFGLWLLPLGYPGHEVGVLPPGAGRRADDRMLRLPRGPVRALPHPDDRRRHLTVRPRPCGGRGTVVRCVFAGEGREGSRTGDPGSRHRLGPRDSPDGDERYLESSRTTFSRFARHTFPGVGGRMSSQIAAKLPSSCGIRAGRAMNHQCRCSEPSPHRQT